MKIIKYIKDITEVFNKINKEAIRVTFVAPYIHSLFKKSQVPFGGAEVQLFLLIKELIGDNRFKITIITGKKKLKKTKILKHKNLELLISQPLDKKILNRIKRPINLFINLYKSAPDIVIQRVGGIETGICGLFTRLFNRLFIFSIAHERDVEKNGRKGFFGIFYNFGLNLADIIITQSRYQKGRLIKWKPEKKQRIKTIKSGYKIKEVSNKDKDIILWIGRGRKWKRGEIFLKLAKFFPERSFIMICNKRKEHLNYWKCLRDESKKIANLEFVESVPFSIINLYFKKAKVFVNTSIKEGFPNTFIQALKNKTPILSLNVNPDNILERFKCGFNCQNNFEKMKVNLNKMLENEELYSRYAMNAYLYARAFHNIKKTSQEWKKVMLYSYKNNNN